AKETFVHKTFVGVDGIDAEHGLTTNYPDQAAIHRVMLKQARQKIVVADHRKVGVVATALISEASDVDFLITDQSTPKEAITPFAAYNVLLTRALRLFLFSSLLHNINPRILALGKVELFSSHTLHLCWHVFPAVKPPHSALCIS